MELKALGKSGKKIPVLGMGTWKLGRDTEEEQRALKKGYELGMKFVDTAEMYNTEDLVGATLNDEIFVATKVSPNHFSYDNVIRACDASLKRLGIKTIDLYQLHWPNSSIPIEETMKAMEKLVKNGKIRYIGVSNFTVKEAEEAQAALKENEIVSNQVEYSIFVKDIENDLLDFCKKEKITVIAYSPLAMGKLYDNRRKNAYDFLSEIGNKYKKSATQVALNWLISKENVVAIPKAGKVEHVKENAGAADFKLGKEDIQKINSFL